jgi:hypothetical protein
MGRIVVALLIGGLLGIAAGFVAGIFVYPYIFLADIVASEEIVGVEAKRIVATGTFIHVDPSDPIHYGSGTATVFDDTVRLEPDFEVGPGPKFHVYLVPSGEVTSASAVENSMFVDLGRLRAFKGSQNYPVPRGVDLGKFGSVVIWCEQFSVLISPASLVFRDQSPG